MSGILVFAEIHDCNLQASAMELLGAAKKLSEQTDNTVSAILIGDIVEVEAGVAIQLGANQVYTISDTGFSATNIDCHVAALAHVNNVMQPSIILSSKTPLGKIVAPRLAYRLGVGVAQDCIDLDADPKTGRVTVTRPVYGGNAIAKFQFNDQDPQVIIIRERAFEPLTQDSTLSGDIIPLDFDVKNVAVKSRLVEVVKEEKKGIQMEDARVIIGGGRGLGGPEPFRLLEELAQLLGGTVGASRAVCDAGWMDHSYQIGLTGKTITPDMYITIGISGASQHMAGCSASKNIVAINRDPDANIFKLADFGVVGDWEQVLPSFTETVRELLDS